MRRWRNCNRTVSNGKLVLTLTSAEKGGFIVTSPLEPELTTDARAGDGAMSVSSGQEVDVAIFVVIGVGAVGSSTRVVVIIVTRSFVSCISEKRNNHDLRSSPPT